MLASIQAKIGAAIFGFLIAFLIGYSVATKIKNGQIADLKYHAELEANESIRKSTQLATQRQQDADNARKDLDNAKANIAEQDAAIVSQNALIAKLRVDTNVLRNQLTAYADGTSADTLSACHARAESLGQLLAAGAGLIAEGSGLVQQSAAVAERVARVAADRSAEVDALLKAWPKQ